MIDWFSSPPMKYYAPPSTTSIDTKRLKIDEMIKKHNAVFSLKTDGNWSRAVITPERQALQTRGISVKTNTYGEIQDKVLFWNDIVKAFPSKTTVILGEVFREGDIDAGVGAVLRSLPPKALERQKNNPLHWRIFDVLCLDDEDLMNKPCIERFARIDEVVKRINSPLVEGVTVHEVDDTFYDQLSALFENGAEGVVCYKKDAIYVPGKRGPRAWDSLKVKQEIQNEIDAVIMAAEPPTEEYTGKDMENWVYWKNERTGEKMEGLYINEYKDGLPLHPISRGYYFNLPGAIMTGVYDKEGRLVPLCRVAGLTDEFKAQLRDNFNEWYLCPVTLGGMMISSANAYENKNGEIVGLSIRHPYLKAIRKDDLDGPIDCTLAKILG